MIKSIVNFSGSRPYYVIAGWIVLMILAGGLSQQYLESALSSGGQGATTDLEYILAEKMRDEKTSSNPESENWESILIEEQTSQQKQNTSEQEEEQGEDNQESSGDYRYASESVIITSEKFNTSSEEYASIMQKYLNELQSKFNLDEQIISEYSNLEQMPGYGTYFGPSPDFTSMSIPIYFMQDDFIEPFIKFNEEFSDDNFQFYLVGENTIEYTFAHLAEEELLTGETIGISVALIILAVIFGYVISAIIPIILAIVSIFVSLGIVSVIGQVVDLNDFVPNIIAMMGLAVGIDYCLFILSRYREERDLGLDKQAAIVSSGSTAGRAVVFSGITVVFALIGMFIIPEQTFQAFGVGAILVVFVAVFAGISLLPAIIGVLGDKVDSVYVPKRLSILIYLVAFLAVALTQGVGPQVLFAAIGVMFLLTIISILRKFNVIKLSIFEDSKAKKSDDSGIWNTITIQVMKRPAISMALAAGFLLLLSYFYLDLDKGTSGISVLPDDEPAKKGFNLLSEKWGYGSNVTANIMIEADTSSSELVKSVQNLEKSINDDPGFLRPEVNFYPSVDFLEIQSRVPGDPNGMESLNSIRRLRNDIIPLAFSNMKENSYTIYVGGESAATVDSVKTTDDYFPIVLGLVLSLSLILLLLAFRSLTVAFASIIMNLLSVGAAYGLLVLVFQKGFLIDIFGFQQVDQLEFWLPLFMFSILFGLSMDYHVFMLSRIKERYDETKSSDESVAFGLRKTASIITGAALIMVAVFGGFALGKIAFFQSMGFGLGAAVLIDATIVRSILVPSVLKLLGDKSWYLPSWLEWIPNISIEGTPEKQK